MTILLDTHVFLWWLFDDAHISTLVRGIIEDRSNQVLVSSASGWEIATKYRIGKLPSASVLVQDIAGWVTKAGFKELPITIAHAQHAGIWPQAHRDPFDRMLAAQSKLENISLASCDQAIQCFGIQSIW